MTSCGQLRQAPPILPHALQNDLCPVALGFIWWGEGYLEGTLSVTSISSCTTPVLPAVPWVVGLPSVATSGCGGVDVMSDQLTLGTSSWISVEADVLQL